MFICEVGYYLETFAQFVTNHAKLHAHASGSPCFLLCEYLDVLFVKFVFVCIIFAKANTI